jgi:hypothetical protein
MPIVVGTGGSGASSDITTYAGLVAAIGTWLNRSDLAAMVPNFISLLEARLNRILRVPEMEATTTLTLDAERVDLPSDFRQARALYLDTDPRSELEAVSLGTLRTKYAQQISGQPEVFAITGTEMVLGPSPDTDYDGILTYYADIEALSAQNTTNWLSLKHPDVYLYGALVMAEAYIWDDERLATLWRPAFDEAIGELQKQGTTKQYGSAPLRLRASVRE